MGCLNLVQPGTQIMSESALDRGITSSHGYILKAYMDKCMMFNIVMQVEAFVADHVHVITH